jgi:hypothetical protein
MKIVFFYNPHSINDATLYYIKLIENASKEIGLETFYTSKLYNVNKKDLVFTINDKYFFYSKLRFPLHKSIFWAQGVGPEEYLLSSNRKGVKLLIKTIIEYIAVNYSSILCIVSNRMLEHFANKYGYKKQNYIAIPCYNSSYDDKLTLRSKVRYNSPSFVYAGNLASWQCIDETLQIFKHIESVLPDASLTVLTKEVTKAETLVAKYNLINVQVKYVELIRLQDELTQYKYGFLIREDNIVNNVATPTKMNSYLASGVIPIYTNSVNSFIENIDLGKYNICLDAKTAIIEKAQTIIEFEKSISIDTHLLNSIIENIFKRYYNDRHYKDQIKTKLKQLLDTD